MMHYLWVIRHAKSSWEFPALDDFDRPLNERGKNDVKRMSKWLHAQTEFTPVFIATSTAKRALDTARKISQKLKLPGSALQLRKELYHAQPTEIIRVIQKFPETAGVAAIVGHNPGLTLFLQHHTDLQLDNLPTCGMACIEWPSWQAVQKIKGKCILWQRPKYLRS